MKKVILSIILCFVLILPAFSETTVNTAQLNKQGWEYLKKKDYSNAYNNFVSMRKYAKTQKDYSYVIYGYLELIKNDEIPASIRLVLCSSLGNNFENKVTDKKLKHLLMAIPFKKVEITANANNEELKNLLKKGTDKQDLLNDYKDMYYSALNSDMAKTKDGKAFIQLYCALYEYAVGNKKTAMFQMGNAMNDIRNYCSDNDIKTANELINNVIELCK